MHKIYILSFIFSLFLTAPTYAADYWGDYIPNAQKVGEGRMSYLMFDLYDAALYASEGALGSSKPFALKLSYLRALKGDKIADRSKIEMQKQNRWSDQQLDLWHQKMLQIFPDVDQGDELTGVYTRSGKTLFFKAGKEIGTINDPDFGLAFFDIWLSEKTSAPDLRKKLLGTDA